MSRLIPFFGFLLLVVLFGFGIWWNTQHDQREVPSPLINKPAPAFALPKLDDFTLQVYDDNRDREAAADLKFFDVLRQKYPQAQRYTLEPIDRINTRQGAKIALVSDEDQARVEFIRLTPRGPTFRREIYAFRI